MTQDKWLDLKAMIKDKFKVEANETTALEDSPGEKEKIVFSTPAGKFRLERTVRPKVIDKKTTYSNRIGGQVKVDYIYSQDEMVDKLNAYRFVEAKNDWEEITPEAFSFKL